MTILAALGLLCAVSLSPPRVVVVRTPGTVVEDRCLRRVVIEIDAPDVTLRWDDLVFPPAPIELVTAPSGRIIGGFTLEDLTLVDGAETDG